MDIYLKNIAPNPLIGSLSIVGEVWKKELHLKPENYIHILAPSGSGKSTLMGILYGIRNDFKGELIIQGESVKNLSQEDWSKLRSSQIAIVFQDLQLLDELTAIENIQIKNQLTNAYTKDEIVKMAKSLDVYELLDKKVALLSRGEKQRIAILRSLCMQFSWLLLDEPFSALDEVNTQKAIALIKTVVTENNAGLILSNLYSDNYFDYTKKVRMA